MPRIVADLLPAAHDVAVPFHHGEQPGDFARVVLQIGVEGDNEFAAGGAETGAERGRLAEIAAEANPADSLVGFNQPPHLGPRAVGRAVVDEDNFQVIPRRLGHGDHLGMERRQAFGFVEQRYDGGEHGGLLVVSCAWSIVSERGTSFILNERRDKFERCSEFAFIPSSGRNKARRRSPVPLRARRAGESRSRRRRPSRSAASGEVPT